MENKNYVVIIKEGVGSLINSDFNHPLHVGNIGEIDKNYKSLVILIDESRYMINENMCKFFNTKEEAENYAKTVESYNNYVIKGDYINNVEQQEEVFNEILKLKNKL